MISYEIKTQFLDPAFRRDIPHGIFQWQMDHSNSCLALSYLFHSIHAKQKSLVRVYSSCLDAWFGEHVHLERDDTDAHHGLSPCHRFGLSDFAFPYLINRLVTIESGDLPPRWFFLLLLRQWNICPAYYRGT
jgi:hypothetical protein